MSAVQADTITKTKIRTDLAPPTMYCVVYYDDDSTPMQFVADTLIAIFGFDSEAALALTETIQVLGSGVAASGLTKELATHLQDLVLLHSEENGFNLKVEVKEQF